MVLNFFKKLHGVLHCVYSIYHSVLRPLLTGELRVLPEPLKANRYVVTNLAGMGCS